MHLFPKNINLEIHPYSLRNLDLFYIPRTNNAMIKRYPLYSFTSTWNELDISLRSIASKLEFKHKLKMFLLDKLKNFECSRLFCYSCSLGS